MHSDTSVGGSRGQIDRERLLLVFPHPEQLLDNVTKRLNGNEEHLSSPRCVVLSECGLQRAHLLFLRSAEEGSARGVILLELRVRVLLTAVPAARRAAPGLLKRRSLVGTTNSTHRRNKTKSLHATRVIKSC